MKNNLILIGMPGVGKSTIGVILAKILGYHFIDSDLVIQQQEQRLLREIIEAEGIDGFLSIENRVNTGLTPAKSIIATGGSAVYGKEAMEHFQEIGHLIYLHLDFPYLQKRLGDIKNRGVVIRPGQTLAELYNERRPLYEKYADMIIDERDLNPEETIEAIIDSLKNWAL
ncbi:MAG: shikimate kinase [Lachnospiraceae bacterium]|nr:shikimate kinase [Lachnospiraceae bacterium]